MKPFIQTFLFLMVTMPFAAAQTKLPILKSNLKSLNIKEGPFLYKDVWGVSPELRPDTFRTNPFEGTNVLIFYSDIDSISFTVEPNKIYDFIVLLNGKDTAYTQINTSFKESPSLEPKLFYTKNKKVPQGTTDTIPFTLGKDHGIHLKGTVNHSDTLDFLFDTGAGACVITSSLIKTKVNLTIDGSQKNGGVDGIAIVGKSSKNTLEMNHLRWENVTLLSIDYQKPLFDLVLGWVAFEDQIVEIDYEKSILIIHPSMPTLSDEYTKLELKLIGGIPYIHCKLTVNGKEIEGWFDFDTGSDGSLTIGQAFAKKHSLNGALKVVGTSISTGSAGKNVLNNEVILPKLKLGVYEMYQIPLSIQQKVVEGVDVNETIGSNLLKRFNLMMDFKNHFIYLKPNDLFYSPMRKATNR